MDSTFSQLFGIASSGMNSNMQDLDVVSNNLANINNKGFKAMRANFQELLNEAQLSGTQLVADQRLMSQGSFETTTNPLDLAISGTGFFGVKALDGTTRYTRDGAFRLDGSNQIVDTEGHLVVWDGKIPADATDIEVAQNGAVSVMIGEERQIVGNIPLYTFTNPAGLSSEGDNLFKETEASGAAQAGTAGTGNYGKTINYTLESSNVDLSTEMTHIVTLQRGFQLTARALQQADDMMSQAIRMRTS